MRNQMASNSGSMYSSINALIKGPLRRANIMGKRTRRVSQRLQCNAFLGPLAASLPSPATGWLLAGTILVSVRLGRKQAEDESLSKIQCESWETLEEQQQNLLSKQVKQRVRNEANTQVATRRIGEAQVKALQEEEELKAQNKRLKEAIDRQKRKAEEARRLEQEEYERREAQMKAEMDARTEEERKIRAQRDAERRERERERRRIEEGKRIKMQQEKLAQEAEKERQINLELERKAIERQQMKKLSKSYTYTSDTTVILEIPPEGTETSGRLPKEALLNMTISAGSISGGTNDYGPISFESISSCEEQLDYQLAFGAFQGAHRYAANARLQNMLGEGPLSEMSEAELVHWMRCATIKVCLKLKTPTKAILKRFGKKREALKHHIQCKYTRNILPEDDDRRTLAVIQKAIGAIESDNMDSAEKILNDFTAEEDLLVSEELEGDTVPGYVGTSLALAFFLDQMWNERPSRRVEASPWYESASNLACQILAKKTTNAPKDSLQGVSALISAVLPEDHVVARQLKRLSEVNLSQKTRQDLREKEELIQAEIAERLVEFEWPDKAELSAVKLKEIEASVPIPERVWALKNVGATQALSGPEGRARARQLLERAVSLKKELVGSARHPGMLPEYEALAGVLEKESEWKRDASALRLRMLSILSDIAEDYLQSGDVTSGIILLEAAIRKIEQNVDPRQSELSNATKRANDLFLTLSDSDKAKIKLGRQRQDVVKKVLNCFQEELAARQVTGTLSQFERWNEQGIWLLGPLYQ